MTRYRVELAPEALAQVETIHAWWLENRPHASSLFLDELSAAIDTLEILPLMGRKYTAARIAELRRIPLARSRYHLYYTVDEEAHAVRIHVVWHMSRGRDPIMDL